MAVPPGLRASSWLSQATQSAQATAVRATGTPRPALRLSSSGAAISVPSAIASARV